MSTLKSQSGGINGGTAIYPTRQTHLISALLTIKCDSCDPLIFVENGIKTICFFLSIQNKLHLLTSEWLLLS